MVPAPRLELQSESRNDLRSILYELAKNAKLEMKRGNKEAVEELLEVFIESGEKFSTFEKKCVENDKGVHNEGTLCKSTQESERVAQRVKQGRRIEVP